MTALQEGLARAKNEGWSHMIRTELDEIAVSEGCYFVAEDAHRACLTIESEFYLPPEGEWEGKKFKLMRWQVDEIVAPLFGWKMPSGNRRFDFMSVWVPKKQSKTTLLGGLANYLLRYDSEPGAKIFSIARAKDQAALCWQAACEIAEESPKLQPHFQIYPSGFELRHPSTGGIYKVLAAGAETKEGKNANAILLDETHVLNDPKLIPAVRYSGAGRRNFLFGMISTAGPDIDSVGGQQYKRAKKVKEGELRDYRCLVVIYEADPVRAEKEPEYLGLESTWKEANPSYGITVKAEEFRTSYQRAAEDPGQEPTLADFMRYRLNIWTDADVKWIAPSEWARCGQNYAVDRSELAGRVCLGGLDLASKIDMAAFVLLFPPESTAGIDIWQVLAWFWVPRAILQEPKKGEKAVIPNELRAKYREWERSGHLIVTEGAVTDYRKIKQHILDCKEEFNLKEIGFDRYDATQITTELDEEHDLDVVKVGQGWRSFNAPIKELEAWLKVEKLAHGNNPVLAWNAKNVVLDKDAKGNRSPDREKSKEKIDGMVCLLMAMHLAINSALIKSESYFQNNDLVVV